MCKIVGIGTDMTTISRFEDALRKPHFMERIYTEKERSYIAGGGQGAAQSAAAMFAAKEAAAKALGTGFARGVMPAQIEVTHDVLGTPGLALHGAAKERFAALGGASAHLSLTHEENRTLAFVVLEGRAT